jgi:hypothetical protein
MILRKVEKEPEKPIEEVVKKVVEAPYEFSFRSAIWSLF